MPWAVGPPYVASRSFSREPPLTPIRIGIFRSLAAATTSMTICLPPMLPGLEPKPIHTLIEGDEREPVVEVDVGHERDPDLPLDLPELFRRFLDRHGAADDVAARRLEGPDLQQGGLHVAGVGLRHGLHGDGSVASHRERAQLDLPGLAPFKHGSRSLPSAGRRSGRGRTLSGRT